MDHPLAPYVQRFFTVHLAHRGVSRRTLESYRDAWKLFVRYVATISGRAVVELRVEDTTSEAVLRFLDDLETTRKNGVSTRNNRLAAIKTFFRFLGCEEPELVERCQRVCGIPFKRGPVRGVAYLESDEMQALLHAPDMRTAGGRQHHAILLFLYNTGARVSELVQVRSSDFQIAGGRRQVELSGKGQKARICPLWKETVRVLEALMQDESLALTSPDRVFHRRNGKPLTRFGVGHIVQKYARIASLTCPSLAKKRVSPHTIRHTTAVHLLNAGVDLTVIQAWLGHVDLRTTHVYAEANLATKRRVLEECGLAEGASRKAPRWRKSADILAWLESL